MMKQIREPVEPMSPGKIAMQEAFRKKLEMMKQIREN